jgi:ribonuclease HII
MPGSDSQSLSFYPCSDSKDRLSFEKMAWNKGFSLVAGVDEAGRGPLAGPVVAAAVILDPNNLIADVDDSKKLSENQREKLFIKIRKMALGIGVGMLNHGEIDRLNIVNATLQAMRRAVCRLWPNPDFLLIDGNTSIPVDLPQKAIVDGDARSLCIAAASIVAKVIRDRKMVYYHKKFPQYNFISNKGYGTREHQKAIAFHGYCPIHRKTFRGVREFVESFPVFEQIGISIHRS